MANRCPMCGQAFPPVKRKRGFEICKGADIRTILPKRKTKHSAGYDVYMPFDAVVHPFCEVVIPLGVKAYMEEDDVLYMHIRSSIAFKLGMKMANCVGVIDSDYYGNPENDGNIGLVLKNESGKTVEIKKGERIAQGIFHKYLLADDDNATEERVGGVGSTGK